jgi:hypothetical protein
MFMLRVRPAFRRFALALAACQLLAYASAPVLEAATDRAPGPIHIEAGHNQSCVPLHAADECLACQLLSASAATPEIVQVVLPIDILHKIESVAPTVRFSRAPPSIVLTRAPPGPLA